MTAGQLEAVPSCATVTALHVCVAEFAGLRMLWCQFDADVRMASGWARKRPDVEFHRNAIWIEDKTLVFGYRKSASHIVSAGAGFNPDSKVKERVTVPGLDFAKWLFGNVKLDDCKPLRACVTRSDGVLCRLGPGWYCVGAVLVVCGLEASAVSA